MNKKHSIQYRQKVLIIAPQPFFQWRGSPIRVKSIVSELSKMGHSVDLLTFPIGENIEIPEVTIIRVANLLGIKNVKIGPSLSKIFFDILILFKGLQLIRSTKYSIIHGVEEGGIISVILSRKSGSKAIFEKHSDPASYKNGCFMNLLLSIYSKVEHLTVKYAHTIICTGPGLAKQVEMMHEEALVYTICDIPSSYIEPTKDEIFNTRQKFVENPDESLITFAGSFTTYQGIDLLMDAIIEVVNQTSKARFVLIGGNDPEIKKWKTILKQHINLDYTRFLGMIDPDKIPAILSGSDILLSTRKNGVNTPLKLLDYLKAGRPIVVTAISANKLLLNKNIASFANPDAKSIADSIIELIKDSGKRESMGTNGRKLYESRFKPVFFRNNLKQCYNYLLENEIKI